MLLAFTDLEMTHRKPELGSIIEVGIIVTDKHLNVLGKFQSIVNPMAGYSEPEDEDVVRMHTDNGLFAEIKAANAAGTIRRRYEVEADTVAFLERFGPSQLLIVGNSIYHDLAWLQYHMPKLASHFHRHLLDITSLNKAAELFAPKLFRARPRGLGNHRALDDASNSLDTLKHYRDYGLFRAPAVELTRQLDTDEYASLVYEFRKE
jgi:oligoribonuclease